jgi:hypothetical protein
MTDLGATLLRLPRLFKFGDFLEFFRRLGKDFTDFDANPILN